MEYKNLVRDFVLRTRKNLEFVEATIQADPDAQVYEVTQLVNSLLGLIIFPKERYFEHIPEISIDELKRIGWEIPKVTGNFNQVRDLRQLMRYLRNSIAHSNLEFDSDGYTLTGIRLWNCRDHQKNWEVRLTIVELRNLTDQFINLILSEEDAINFEKRSECQNA
jgi:hypothetical protein